MTAFRQPSSPRDQRRRDSHRELRDEPQRDDRLRPSADEVGDDKIDLHDRIHVTAVAWLPHTGLTQEEWQEYGRRLRNATNKTNWWLGDWIRWGERRYNDNRYELAHRIVGYEYQTLRNLGWVAGHYERTRRRENLSWSHHEAVASLPPPDQDRLLDLAIAHRLTVKQLREHGRQQRHGTSAAASVTHDEHTDPQAELADFVPLSCPDCGRTIIVRRAAFTELTKAAKHGCPTASTPLPEDRDST
jgi:predicted RNA-binding Zn-ribbon protein involved in translation (DUF1610 family)